MFVGRDPRTNVGSILGSGFIVGVNGQILVLSAAHVFVDWVERVRPSAPHALRGLVGDAEDFRNRFMSALRDLGTFHAVLDLGHAVGPRVATIGSITLTHDYLRNDTALVQLELPSRVRERMVGSILMDPTPFDSSHPILMAGIVGGQLQMTDALQVTRLSQLLTVNAGFMVEHVEQADGYRGIPMYRVNMPSHSGMSGGPALVIRQRVNGGPVPTAIGIVSRSRLSAVGRIELLDHCRDGETWVSPIRHVYGQPVQTAKDGTLPLSEVIRRGLLYDYETYERAPSPSTARKPKTGPGWRLKVTFTNGEQTRDLLSLMHKGHTIIAGLSGSTMHSTYHASGERHTRVERGSGSEYHAARDVDPPDELQGIEQMHVLGFHNEADWFGEQSPFPRSRPSSRADVIVTLDSCSMQRDAEYQVRLGVVGTSERRAFEAEIARIAIEGVWAIERQELFEVRRPFVWLIVVRAIGAGPGGPARGTGSALITTT